MRNFTIKDIYKEWFWYCRTKKSLNKEVKDYFVEWMFRQNKAILRGEKEWHIKRLY